MDFKNHILVILGLILFTNCKPVRVLYTDRYETSHKMVSVYYDRMGDIYPDETVRITSSDLKDGGYAIRQVFDNQVKLNGCESVFESWTGSVNRPVEWQEKWLHVQELLIQRSVDEINKQLDQAGPGAHLVILIHGFNSTMEQSRTWYSIARDTIRNRYGDKPHVFLNLYWDGWRTSGLPNNWAKAQHNFPIVGLEFRRMLNRLDPSIPVRVLAHSSGAPLFMNTLGNATEPFKKRIESSSLQFKRYYLIQNDETTWVEKGYGRLRFDDFRIGMIVPAASNSTFEKFKAPHVPDFDLVVGVNYRDYAITKLIVPCRFRGATCLGKLSRHWNRPIRTLEQVEGISIHVKRLDWSRNNTSMGLFWDDHGMEAYLKRSKTKAVLDALFEM